MRNACSPALSFSHRRKLRQIMDTEGTGVRGIVIYPPTVDWNITLKQRPHHLAYQLSRLGYLFFYCTLNDRYDAISGFKRLANNLYLTNRYDLLIDNVRKSWLMLSSTNRLITFDDILTYRRNGFMLLYDYIDQIHPDVSRRADFIQRRHNQLDMNSADLVITTSSVLHKEMISRFPRNRVLLLHNAVEYEHFRVERNREAVSPKMREIIEEGKPIIGYYGAFAKWIDYETLNFVALKRPQWNIVLIGEELDFERPASALSAKKNVKYLGKIDYRQLPHYGIWFDVAIIPFRDGDVAKATSPLKLYEYMAMHKPVVVTKDLTECKHYQGVFVSNSREDFVEKIEEALKLKDAPVYKKLLDAQAKKNTWKARARKISDHISQGKTL